MEGVEGVEGVEGEGDGEGGREGGRGDRVGDGEGWLQGEQQEAKVYSLYAKSLVRNMNNKKAPSPHTHLQVITARATNAITVPG